MTVLSGGVQPRHLRWGGPILHRVPHHRRHRTTGLHRLGCARPLENAPASEAKVFRGGDVKDAGGIEVIGTPIAASAASLSASDIVWSYFSTSPGEGCGERLAPCRLRTALVSSRMLSCSLAISGGMLGVCAMASSTSSRAFQPSKLKLANDTTHHLVEGRWSDGFPMTSGVIIQVLVSSASKSNASACTGSMRYSSWPFLVMANLSTTSECSTTVIWPNL